MKYNYRKEPVSQGLRQAVNEKICRLIENGGALDKGITKEDIFNLYTGDGGLHGLQASEYTDYNAYKLAKQEIENGQFFTPPPVCEFIIQCLQIAATETVGDLTCGSGNFFNYLPIEANAYGCDSSGPAIQVARYLYPDAHLENADIRDYEPPVPLDFVVGNPPFNLRWQVEEDTGMGESVLSQAYYCQKAAHMKPLGILALVVPCSYLADTFTDSRMIAAMEQQFSFLGQFRLSPSAFSYLGVTNFPTKVQFWQRRCDLSTWSARPYTTAMSLDVDIQQADALQKVRALLAPARQDRETLRLHVILETAQRRELCQGDFQYQVRKLLYQIRIHPRLKDKYPKCCDNAVAEREVADELYAAILAGKVVACGEAMYLTQDFAMEDDTARHIASLIGPSAANPSLTRVIQDTASELGIALSPKQQEAVEMVFRNNLSMITGSPGTGKTTVLKVLTHAYRKLHRDAQILLAAPTGKASRRMADSTGCPDAKTLHSLLKLGVGAEEGNYRGSGAVTADLLVVDEFTLADMWLSSVLFTRVAPGTRILLVGDADQLPSVGAGSVFQEMIDSGAIPVTRLHEVFRQAAGSPIIRNAVAIREKRAYLDYGDDFRLVECQTQADAAELIEEIYLKEVAKSGVDNVQILTPKREDGDVSAQQLNARIREIVNPAAAETPEVMVGDRIFRQNDRVIQTKNEKIGDEKIYVFNGDIGSIRSIESAPGKEAAIDIAFSGSRLARYTASDMRFVQTAYAITIHKFMGSECDTVIVPVLMAHSFFLNRNLIYTAVTRAKRRVILVGQKKALAIAIKTDGNKRNTMLGLRIQQYAEALRDEAQLKAG